LLETVPDFVISNQDLTGQIVIGSAPRTNFNWSGRIKGLAIYDRKLSGFEVAQSFVDWAKGREVDPAKNDGIVASYLFDEGKGNVVHNQVDPSTDLLIPKRFFVLDQQFLERPWNEFHPGWNYWKDVAINIVGFIPLGFFFYAYLYQVRKVEYAAALAVAFGFAVSLTIEVLQAFLPTRDSGMTDLITNTLGTAIGVMAFRHKAVQALVAVAAVRTAKESVSAVAG
jgi:VanZ family protein